MISNEWKKGEIAVIDSNPYPDRYFTLASTVLSVVGVLLSGWSVFNSDPIPGWIVLTKDLAIFFTLLILALFFFVRYRMVLSSKYEMRTHLEHELTAIRDMINGQFNVYHKLMSRTREYIYYEANEQIYPHRFNYNNPELNDLLRDTLENTIGSMVDILKTHLKIRDSRIEEEISFSIKVVVTGAMVKSLCKNISNDDADHIKPKENYVITLDRDSTGKVRGREVLSAAYSLEKNTAFIRIWSREEDYFLSNNLGLDYESGKYKNQHVGFLKEYSATLVVPISHTDNKTGKKTIFGFLTVDSLNKGKHGLLFSMQDTKPIMNFGADLLALVMLNIEMFDMLEKSNEALQRT